MMSLLSDALAFLCHFLQSLPQRLWEIPRASLCGGHFLPLFNFSVSGKMGWELAILCPRWVNGKLCADEICQENDHQGDSKSDLCPLAGLPTIACSVTLPLSMQSVPSQKCKKQIMNTASSFQLPPTTHLGTGTQTPFGGQVQLLGSKLTFRWENRNMNRSSLKTVRCYEETCKQIQGRVTQSWDVRGQKILHQSSWKPLLDKISSSQQVICSGTEK